LYVPTAKNILSGSKIVQNPKHRVEIDSVGTRILCNAGTCPTLHMNYDNEGELWYFIGARVSPTAHVCEVTHGTVSEDEDEVELEMSGATRVSPTNKRNKIGSTSSNNNNKEVAFSGYLQGYKTKSTHKVTNNKKVQKKVYNKEKSKVKRIYLDINEAHQKFGHMSERMLQLTAKRDNIVLTGKLQPRPACLLYKATQRPVKKTTLMKASYPGERIHMDVSCSFPNTLGGHNYWVMFKDQYSGMAWNVFIPSNTKVYEVAKDKL
jgi:hypothetical protein